MHFYAFIFLSLYFVLYLRNLPTMDFKRNIAIFLTAYCKVGKLKGIILDPFT